MSPTTRPLRPRRAAAVVLVALSLTGISACSISVGGGSTDQGTAAAAGQEDSAPEQSAASSPSTTATTASQAPRSQAAAPSTQEQASPAAVGSSAPEAGAQPASGERPGARATITDSDWLGPIRMEQGGVQVNAEYDFGGATLTSVSAARFWNWTPRNCPGRWPTRTRPSSTPTMRLPQD